MGSIFTLELECTTGNGLDYDGDVGKNGVSITVRDSRSDRESRRGSDGNGSRNEGRNESRNSRNSLDSPNSTDLLRTYTGMPNGEVRTNERQLRSSDQKNRPNVRKPDATDVRDGVASRLEVLVVDDSPMNRKMMVRHWG
jgi:hypothetical protein